MLPWLKHVIAQLNDSGRGASRLQAQPAPTSGLRLKFKPLFKELQAKDELVKSLGKYRQHGTHSLLSPVSGYPCLPPGMKALCAGIATTNHRACLLYSMPGVHPQLGHSWPTPWAVGRQVVLTS